MEEEEAAFGGKGGKVQNSPGPGQKKQPAKQQASQ